MWVKNVICPSVFPGYLRGVLAGNSNFLQLYSMYTNDRIARETTIKIISGFPLPQYQYVYLHIKDR